MSLRVKKKIKIGEYLAKVTSKMHFARLANTLLKDEKRFDRIMVMILWPTFWPILPEGNCLTEKCLREIVVLQSILAK